MKVADNGVWGKRDLVALIWINRGTPGKSGPTATPGYWTA